MLKMGNAADKVFSTFKVCVLCHCVLFFSPQVITGLYVGGVMGE